MSKTRHDNIQILDISIEDHCLDHDSICTIFSNCSSLLRSIHILYEKSENDKTSGTGSMKDNLNLLKQSRLCGSESVGGHVVPKVCCSLKTKTDDQIRYYNLNCFISYHF